MTGLSEFVRMQTCNYYQFALRYFLQLCGIVVLRHYFSHPTCPEIPRKSRNFVPDLARKKHLSVLKILELHRKWGNVLFTCLRVTYVVSQTLMSR